VPAAANLREEYASFGELEAGCEAWCERVNGRIHRETREVPAQRLAAEIPHLHSLPAEPYVLALGEERLVNDDQTVRFGSVRYSTPPGHVGDRVWCRVHGTELVVVSRAGTGLAEIARHALPTPGTPRIDDEHYPHHPGGTARGSPGPGRAPALRRRSWSWARSVAGQEEDVTVLDLAGFVEERGEGAGDGGCVGAVLGEGLGGDKDEAGVCLAGGAVLGVEGMKSLRLAVAKARPAAVARAST
jgi:hypothetical protein